MLRDLVKNLVCFDTTQRFGALKSGARDVKAHAWFAELDWNQLAARTLPAPYVPPISVRRVHCCGGADHGRARWTRATLTSTTRSRSLQRRCPSSRMSSRTFDAVRGACYGGRA